MCKACQGRQDLHHWWINKCIHTSNCPLPPFYLTGVLTSEVRIVYFTLLPKLPFHQNLNFDISVSLFLFFLFFFYFIVVLLQLSQFFPCCFTRPHPLKVNHHPVVHVHGSFIHVPRLVPSPFSCFSLPTSPLVTVSLFLVSTPVVLFCLFVCLFY